MVASIRTDIPEDTLFTTLVLTPLSMANRYAQGIVWADHHTTGHLPEMRLLKEMLLWVSGNTTLQ